MSGNVMTVVETAVPTSPDVAMLQGMQDPLVMVYRMIQRGGNKRESQLVINGLTPEGKSAVAKTKAILKLQELVADTSKFPQGGPGLYRFEVTDSQSTAKSIWESRIGTQPDENVEGEVVTSTSPVRISTPMPVGPPPTGPDVVNFGNGFTYNERFNILTDRYGRIHKWDPSQPLPEVAPTPPPATPLATPIGTPFFGNQSASPELEALRVKLEAANTELQRARDESRENARQRELQQEREQHRQQINALSSKLEAITERLTAKPLEDPIVLELRRKLEDRERQDALRAEVDSKIDQLAALVRETQANRGPDPMLSTLTQMLSQQAQMFQEQLRTIRESSTAQLAAASQTALTPDRLFDMLHRVNEMNSNGGINEKLVGTVGSMLDTVLRFRQAEQQLGGGGGGRGGIDWMQLFGMLSDKASETFTAFSQMKARQAAAEVAKENSKTVQAQVTLQRERRAATAKLTSVPQQPPTSSPTEATPESVDAANDALAAQMYPPRPAATVAADAPVSTPVVETSEETPPAFVPDKSSPLARATVKSLRKAYGQTSDDRFFGEALLPHIVQLREMFVQSPDTFDPDAVASLILDARPQIAEAAQKVSKDELPIAVAMLGYGKFEYLFERILPTAGELFWKQAAEALRAKVAAERAAE
jgi:hypothetical protein